MTFCIPFNQSGNDIILQKKDKKDSFLIFMIELLNRRNIQNHSSEKVVTYLYILTRQL